MITFFYILLGLALISIVIGVVIEIKGLVKKKEK